MNIRHRVIAMCVAALAFAYGQQVLATTVQITVTNNAPTGGVYLTPVWFGFHDGSFDSYDGGAAASAALESIAEDGNTGPISSVFDGTLLGEPVGGRVQGVVGGAPIAPGHTVSFTIDVNEDGSNNYFSYASMVLPSSDYFVANGDPFAHSIADIINGVASEIAFNIGMPGTVNDAGTEVNDFDTSAGNGLFGFGGGQMGPNQGADEGSVIQNVAGDPFASFLNQPGADLSALNFNNAALYGNGIATITISAVPIPAALPLLITALAGFGLVGRRRV